jgi:hypothetical protein
MVANLQGMNSSRAVSALKMLPPSAVKSISLEVSRLFPKRGKGKKLFNLDLHVSVIRDITMGLAGKEVDVTSWSISRHNHMFRNFFTAPDPVRYINARNWQKLDERLISNFLEYYKKHLDQYDGFIVTHTPVFHQIFESLGKPILIINSTRYESPHTNNLDKWRRLDQSLIESVKNGRSHIYSNNTADSKYLEYFTGLKSDVVPSLCDYTGATWNNARAERVYLMNRIHPHLHNRLAHLQTWKSSGEVFGSRFSWNQMQTVGAVFLIPYNVSTMQLFELATAGIPVVVPSKQFLTELFLDSLALQEVSNFKLENLSIDDLAAGDPNNYKSPEFLQFWLDSADFYNRDLMPNVRTIDSFEELDSLSLISYDVDVSRKLMGRNEFYRELRSKMLSSFLENL